MLEVSGISVFYGDLQALWDVSISVRAEEVVTIIGSNGAGKTTTLNAISGILKPGSGSVTFAGRAIDGVPTHAIVELGLVQIPEGRMIFPAMTVLENLHIGSYPRAARIMREESAEYVFELFPRLRERKNQLAGTLSGGEQQMLAIGRGLMSKPKLLMLDEPSLGLAPLLVAELFKTIKKINSGGIPILLVEQNVKWALEIADRAYILENGKIIGEGRAKELMADDFVKESYLGL